MNGLTIPGPFIGGVPFVRGVQPDDIESTSSPSVKGGSTMERIREEDVHLAIFLSF
jgi:hypothetical protein